ncbi:MAG: hypothetical protein EOP04_11250 [Proteobacteria bacterium]|nr:MAG: hypothetical protein EOP04_11250 [Pseudomonadota bacterium]
MFKKRIGPDPHKGGRETKSKNGCPDIWELENGDFAIIGISATSKLKDMLPPTAGCGDDESIVIIPRETLTRAKNDIPNS